MILIEIIQGNYKLFILFPITQRLSYLITLVTGIFIMAEPYYLIKPPRQRDTQ